MEIYVSKKISFIKEKDVFHQTRFYLFLCGY